MAGEEVKAEALTDTDQAADVVHARHEPDVVHARHEASRDIPSSAARPATTCPCCENLGVLPGQPTVVRTAFGPVTSELVSGEVILTMCEACVIAAFVPGNRDSHPHPHPIAGAQP